MSIQRLLQSTTLKSKVFLLLGSIGLLALLYFIYTFNKLDQIQAHNQELYAKKYPALENISDLNAALNHSSVLMSSYLSGNRNAEYRYRWEVLWTIDIQDYKYKLRSAELFTKNKKMRDIQRKLLISLQNIELRQNELMDDAELVDILVLHMQVDQKINPLITEFNDNAMLLESFIVNNTQAEYSELDRLLENFNSVNIIFLLLSIITTIGFGIIIISNHQHIKKEIRAALAVFNRGDLLKSGQSVHKDNSDMDASMSKLSKQLENVRNFASKVGEGHLSNDISVFNNEGEIGVALAGMRDSLSRVSEEDKQRNWLNTGYAKFGDILRENNKNMADLCDAVVINLVKYLEANQGAIFLIDSTEEGVPVLKMKSCYAYERMKREDILIYKGEGLMGRAWQEEDTIFLTDIPDNYVNIKSGLGNANPKCLIIVPLIANEVVIGSLELASFHVLSDYQREFVEKVSDNIAAAIANTQGTERTQNLLEVSQQMTEELQAQEEEMRQNMEELEATQEEMKRAQTEIERSGSNMSALINNTSDIIFAIDREYIITVANNVVQKFFKKEGLILEEGTNMMSVLSEEEKEFWKPRYDRTLKGEKFKEVNKSKGADGILRYMETSYNPIMNAEEVNIGASIISRDVTELTLAEKQIMKKQSMLASILDNTNDTFFAVDSKYKITIVNKTLQERFSASKIELNEGDSIFDKLPKETYDFWKGKYDKALNGESFSFIHERPVKDKMLTVEVFCNPVVDGNGQVIGASVMSRDVSQRIKAENKLKKLLKQQDAD